MKRILLIDDEAVVRGALKAVLEQRGYAVEAAADGVKGLEAFKSFKPDLVLLDRDLPGMSGSHVLREIRRLDKEVDVVVLTGHPGAPGEEKYRALGISHFLGKDTSIEKLVEIIEGETGREKAPLVLVADDDRQIRDVLRRFLEGKGYRVETVVNGLEALVRIKSGAPDVTLLDLNMPVMGGVDVLERVREAGLTPSVIMITGSHDEDAARKCMELGASDCIVKPFNFDALETSVWVKIQTATPKHVARAT